MHILIDYFKNYKKQSIIGPLFKLLEAVFELIVPLIVAAIIDKGIENNDMGLIVRYVGLMAVFALVGYSCALIAQYFASYVANNISCSIRADLFKRILRMNLTQYDDIGSSGILTSLTDDVNQISNGINLFLRLLLRSPFIVVGASVMAMTIDFKAAMIFVLVVALLALIIVLNMRTTLPLFKESRVELGNLSGRTNNGISGVRTIRSFNKSEDDFNTFSNQNSKFYSIQIKAAKISALLNPITFAVINLCICALIYYGAIQVDSGILTKGMVIALYNYMSQILVEIIKLSNLVVNVSRSIACVNKVEDMLKEDDVKASDNADSIDRSKEAISFKDVSFTYLNNSDATLKNVSFAINKGETIGIIGKTGSGKSTIAKLISGLYESYEGRICLYGKELNSIDEDNKAKLIGLVTQKTNVITGTIDENIIVKRSGIDEASIVEAINNSCLDEVIDRTKDKRLHMLYSNGSGTGLSGGQKQRLGIARVLAGNPEILIFDDSTSALDANTESRLLTNISNLKNKPTVVIISQRIRSVKNCDKILYVDDGEIVGFDTHENLYNKLDDYKNFCLLQGQELK
ncbi:MAG: ABC transporter ATP-binding protein/permease [Clostridia bacterium]|nr:ABC transporter ATP-binding protein/permease [Clostridia bacterium]